jgi:hypothetical protein
MIKRAKGLTMALYLTVLQPVTVLATEEVPRLTLELGSGVACVEARERLDGDRLRQSNCQSLGVGFALRRKISPSDAGVVFLAFGRGVGVRYKLDDLKAYEFRLRPDRSIFLSYIHRLY